MGQSGEDTRWTIRFCPACNATEADLYNHDPAPCPSCAIQPLVDVEVVPASALAQALEERDQLLANRDSWARETERSNGDRLAAEQREQELRKALKQAALDIVRVQAEGFDSSRRAVADAALGRIESAIDLTTEERA